MDAHTLELLDFARIQELVGSFAAGSMGKELAAQMRPSTQESEVRAALEATAEMTELVSTGNPPPLGGLHDLRRELDSVEGGKLLNPEELCRLNDTLFCFTRLRNWLDKFPDKSPLPLLRELGRRVGRFGDLSDEINRSIDREGNIADEASSRLKQIRAETVKLKEEIYDRVQSYVNNTTVRGYLQTPQATWSGDRYVLPVKADYRGKIPGIVHRCSATGETIFVEPSSVVELGNAIQTLLGQEQQEVTRILRELMRRLAGELRALRRTLNVAAEFDLLAAKARFGLEFRAVQPEISPDGSLRLRSARHPILVHLFTRNGQARTPGPKREVVPIDVHLGDRFDVLVITGPNTGGKTVTLKTVGVLAVMAQCGLFVTAGYGAKLPVFRGIFADIGDEQGLEQSLSTYSSHVKRIAEIITQASKLGAGALVLLDELGAGTDPAEGAALGRALLDELLRLRSRAIVTTHLGALKTYAYTHDRAENACVEFDAETLRPTYRLIIGQPGNSNALNIAEKLGLNPGVVFRARRYLAETDTSLSQAIDEISKQRREAELARLEAEKAEAAAAAARQEMEKKLSELAGRKAVDQAREDFRARLQPGDKIWVPRFGSTGQFLRYVGASKTEAMVQVGFMHVRLPLLQVYPPQEATA